MLYIYKHKLHALLFILASILILLVACIFYDFLFITRVALLTHISGATSGTGILFTYFQLRMRQIQKSASARCISPVTKRNHLEAHHCYATAWQPSVNRVAASAPPSRRTYLWCPITNSLLSIHSFSLIPPSKSRSTWGSVVERCEIYICINRNTIIYIQTFILNITNDLSHWRPGQDELTRHQ